MVKRSICNPDFFEIIDEETNKIYYGCMQTWYKKFWRRLSGCGPTVATNIILYLNHNKYYVETEKSFNKKKDCASLMDEVWNYVTPTSRGVNTTKIFYEGVCSYAEAKEINLEYEILDFPKEKLQRPSVLEVLEFIEKALLNDSPVAFLNLNNGKEKNLDEWHWVTIISLEYEEDQSVVYAEILDEGIIKRIDLLLWYNTTTLGGGFVYFPLSIK
nr:hypothetical protein [Sedimentibacter sp.]